MLIHYQAKPDRATRIVQGALSVPNEVLTDTGTLLAFSGRQIIQIKERTPSWINLGPVDFLHQCKSIVSL